MLTKYLTIHSRKSRAPKSHISRGFSNPILVFTIKFNPVWLWKMIKLRLHENRVMKFTWTLSFCTLPYAIMITLHPHIPILSPFTPSICHFITTAILFFCFFLFTALNSAALSLTKKASISSTYWLKNSKLMRLEFRLKQILSTFYNSAS